MFGFLKKLLRAKAHASLTDAEPMKKYLIAGLGNIGPEYANTRHNIGFQIIDALAETETLSWETKKLGALTTFRLKGRTLILLKPATFMNRSGKAIKYWLEKEKIPLDHLLVITDDLNLPFGTLRLKTKGSDGGHNGLRDIQSTLGTTSYSRLRVGIGDEFSRGQQVNYVLGEWTAAEEEKLPERLKRAGELVKSFVLAGPNRTMNQFNGS